MTMSANVLLLVAVLLLVLYAQAARAQDDATPPDESVVTTFPAADDPRYAITVIRGASARATYHRLSPRLERTQRDRDGLTYRARSASAVGCSYAAVGDGLYLCAFAVRENGHTLPVLVYPGFRSTPRIGVSN